tara:strand:+ start:714 stop:1406 length:693 start_codon:yes stop_codon:yes gene_type:complete
MALSTKDLQGSASVRKTIAPGNHTLKINSVNLEKFKFVEDAYHLMLNLETEPLKDFEGFLLDPENPEKGNYNGQIGRVKAGKYAFADGETKSGIKVNRDRSILMFIKNLSKSLDVSEGENRFSTWFSDQDGEHETIEEFVEAFNTEIKSGEKVYMNFCIAGKEYENRNGYINYDMFLPRASRGEYSFGDKVINYNEEAHLVKLPVKNVEAFGDDDDISIPNNTSNDFSLD